MRDTVSILPVRLSGLTYEASGKRLLSGISCDIARGGITGLIGPNGAGKSLLLRLLHGLLTPTAGSIAWNAPAARGRAMVFQRPVMLRRSAQANILHAVRAVGMSEPEARSQAALARFGLEALAQQPARLLSGGEQQRLAIARAWALKPEVMFLDEPTSQLDVGATRQIEEMIAGLAAEGMTIVIATHDLGQARRLSSRVLFLHGGGLLEDAAAASFFTTPATAQARAFLAGDLLW